MPFGLLIYHILLYYNKFLLSAIEKLTLNINTTDISSDDIERVINPPTSLFNNLNIVIVNDKSLSRGTLGVFNNLFKKFNNIKTFEINSNDRNLRIILEECLPKMTKLEKMFLSTDVLPIDNIKAFKNLNSIILTVKSSEDGNKN